MDGGSTDGSVEIIGKVKQYLRWWTSEPDRGQADALNRGFARATGEVLGYINSDDVLLPGALETVRAVFEGRRCRGACISQFGGIVVDEHDAVVEHVRPPRSPRLSDWLSGPHSLFQPATFWTGRLHRALGGFRTDFHFCFDKEFFLRAVFEHEGYVPGTLPPIAGFRIHPESKTSNLGAVCARENERIRAEVGGRRWARMRLAKETAWSIAEDEMARAYSETGRLRAMYRLFRAVVAAPTFAANRQWLGALRATCRRPERHQ